MLAAAGNAADGDAAEADPVIGALAADQAVTQGVAAHAVVGQGDLECGIDAFRTVIDEEYAVHAFRRDIDQRAGRFEDFRVAHLEAGRIIHFSGLAGDGFDDLRMAVTGIDAPQACGAVENLTAVVARVVHALGGDQQARFGFELAVGRKRHPEVFGIDLVRWVGHHDSMARQKRSILAHDVRFFVVQAQVYAVKM